MTFRTIIIIINVLGIFWALIEVDSAGHSIDVSLKSAQQECEPYFDELHKGSGV